MALPLRALLGLFFLLFVIGGLLPDHVHAWRTAHPHHLRRGHGQNALIHKHHRPKFKPGPWINAHATFYEGGSGTFGMNYEILEPYKLTGEKKKKTWLGC